MDTCGYLPNVVRRSADLLRDAVDRYLFVSTISVYDDIMQPAADENAKLQTLPDPTVDQVTNQTYGGLKVLCEQVVSEIYGDRAVNLRPGMIVGPHDPTDRYTYWVKRAARGGEILAPGAPDRPVQMIDARDLGAWMLHLLEAGIGGVFNATSPATTWGAWLDAAAQAAGTSPTYTWVGDEFLQQHEVNGGDLPFWVPAPYQNIFAVSVDRALRAGLTFRPMLETARDTLAWKGADDLHAGLKPEREADLLAAWHSQT